jgi:hypothetical protein
MCVDTKLESEKPTIPELVTLDLQAMTTLAMATPATVHLITVTLDLETPAMATPATVTLDMETQAMDRI